MPPGTTSTDILHISSIVKAQFDFLDDSSSGSIFSNPFSHKSITTASRPPYPEDVPVRGTYQRDAGCGDSMQLHNDKRASNKRQLRANDRLDATYPVRQVLVHSKSRCGRNIRCKDKEHVR